MKINKYLKEIGIEWYDLPGVYKEELHNDNELCDCPAADCRNEEDEEGFCEYEFFNLDHTLDLFIYPRLCYFREYIAPLAIPSCFISSNRENEEEGRDLDHELWLKVLDEMIEGFKLALVGDEFNAEVRYKVQHAKRLLAEYWHCLWY